MVQPPWKTVWSFQKTKNRVTYDPVISLLDVCLNNLKTVIFKDVCTPMSTALLFMLAKTWKQLDDWIMKMGYIYTMEYYSAIRKDEILPFTTSWVDLESIMLNKSEAWLVWLSGLSTGL